MLKSIMYTSIDFRLETTNKHQASSK